MTQLLDLQARQHTSRVLSTWLAADPARAARSLQNATAVGSDSTSMSELFSPIRSASGFAINDYTALMVSTVFACLSKISGAVLQLPLHQYMRTLSGERERMAPTPLWWMLNEQPVANWTAASWKEWIVRCVHLRGDQHTEILRSSGAGAGGKPVGLKPHHPDCVQSRYYVLDGEVRLAYDVIDPIRNLQYSLDQDDMLHFTGFGFDGRRSISVIQHAARNAIGNALAASDFSGKSLGNGAMPKIALTYPARMNPDQADLLRKSFVATYGAGPTQQQFPLILTEGGTATPLNISPVDMELLGSRKLEQQQICEAMGVPPIMIGNSEKTSSWGTGVEQITLGFVKFTLQPHLCRWEEELNRKLHRRAGQFIEFELDALLRGDSKAQAEAFRFALGGPGSGDGYMAVNEVRKLKNLPSAGPEFDKPFRAQRGTTVKPPSGKDVNEGDDSLSSNTGEDE